MIKKWKLRGTLFYLFLVFLCNTVWAFAGNLYVEEALTKQAGVKIIGVYAGRRVNQAGGEATIKLIANTHFRSEPGPFLVGDGDQAKNYIRIAIYDSPKDPAHILFDNGTGYFISSFSLGTNVPNDSFINSANVVWYKKGPPVPPLITANDITKGYEVAKANWNYPTAAQGGPFEYSKVKIQVIDLDGDKALVPAVNAQGVEANETILSGYPPIKEYAFGEMLDGRILLTDNDGHNYGFNLVGCVDGQPDSGSAKIAFATKALVGGQAGPQEFTITLLRGTGAAPGINNFSMPIAPNNPDNPDAANYGWFVGERPIKTAADLKTAIVAAAGGAEIVSSIGEWDAQNGVVKGVMLAVDGSVRAGVGGANLLSDIKLYPGKGYQVYLTPILPADEGRDGAREIALTIRNAAVR